MKKPYVVMILGSGKGSTRAYRKALSQQSPECRKLSAEFNNLFEDSDMYGYKKLKVIYAALQAKENLIIYDKTGHCEKNRDIAPLLREAALYSRTRIKMLLVTPNKHESLWAKIKRFFKLLMGW